VLNNAVSNANKELQTAMAGSNGSASLELVSLERHTFTSTAHYRLKGEGEMFGDQPVELLFVDHIEHGPLPFSRLVSLKWLPVMATSQLRAGKEPGHRKMVCRHQGRRAAQRRDQHRLRRIHHQQPGTAAAGNRAGRQSSLKFPA
jgi:uncharacterized protein YdgA (DUF945 family)